MDHEVEDFDDYQRETFRTLRPEDEQAKTLAPQETTLLLGALGMCGEAGEFADHVKKILFHDQELTPERLAKMKAELGDILWYHSIACRALETTMRTVAKGNIDKLLARHPNGVDFSYHDRQMEINQKAIKLAAEGNAYYIAPTAEWAFVTAGNEFKFTVSEQHLANNQLPATEDGVRKYVHSRLLEILEDSVSANG